MPTYDYKCDACGHAFEDFHSITAKPLRKCPACGKLKLRRLIGTGAGIIFKGGGFYETDYRSDSYKKAAKAESDSAKPAESKSESKSEGKSDAKTEAKPAKTEPAKPAPASKKPEKHTK
ncbi:MAG: FmdB family zinc ribbon protein [Phycisphaeraceae bacterium]